VALVLTLTLLATDLVRLQIKLNLKAENETTFYFITNHSRTGRMWYN